MTNEEILQIELKQSAYDCNCDFKDFLLNENKIVVSRQAEGVNLDTIFLFITFKCFFS
ncbi:MAG: hypothetical protein LIO43_04745 [Clostridiales bacterium]|nr:hypothetical protein [Clostridiales bacterium]